MRLLLFVAMLFVVASPAAQAGESKIDFTDLTGEFAAYWAQSQTLPDAERAVGFRKHFAGILPGFYVAERNSVDPKAYDSFIAQSLKAWPRQKDGVEEVSRRFTQLLTPAIVSFEEKVGPIGPQRVILLHSMGEMDGGVRTLNGVTMLVFGADRIADLHLAHRIEPFFHHELFHRFHAARYSGCDELWCNLWSEGLAVYAAQQLTPDATDAELLLNVPQPIRAEVEANRALAVCTLAAKLDSTEGKDFRVLFDFKRADPQLPARYGYYVGYLVAAELGKTRSLAELAELDPKPLRPLFEAALYQLSPCPPSN